MSEMNNMIEAKKQVYQIIHDDEIDLKALWMVLWTNKLALVKITAGFFLMGIIYLLFATTLYYSNSIIVQTEEEASSSMGSIVDMAAAVGMDIGGSSSGAAVSIIDFVLSRRLRDNILEKKWLNKNQNEIDLIAFWDISDTTGIIYALQAGLKNILNMEATTEAEIRIKWFEKGRNILAERVRAQKTDTGLTMIEVWMEDPLIARNMTNYIIEAMIEYTNKLKVERWKTNREFLIKRMDEVKVEMKQTENNMIKFQKDNQRVMDSPELLIDLANLKREVEMKTQIYMTLQGEYEFARLEEAKDLSGIVILDSANYPTEVDQPSVMIILIVSVLLGSVLSIPIFLIYRGIRQL